MPPPQKTNICPKLDRFKGKENIMSKIVQIIPAPGNMRYGLNDFAESPVVCLALVECGDGEQEVHAMGLTNCEFIEDVTEAGAALVMP